MEKLRFYKESAFYDKDGKLQEEPYETLQELLDFYNNACKSYRDFAERQREAEKPYVKTRWINNVEPTFIESESHGYDRRTIDNAEWSDITLAFAADFSTHGERLTREAAGDKYIAVELPKDIHIFRRCGRLQERLEATANAIASQIRCNPHFNEDGIKLNVAGNGAMTLSKAGFDKLDDVDYYIANIIHRLEFYRISHIAISEIRTGGQTGVDEAGIKAAQHSGIKCSVLVTKGFRMMDKDGVEIEDREKFVERFKETYVDYDMWDKVDPKGCMDWGLASFNGFSGLDMTEFEIDLKVMHLNNRVRRKF